MEKGKGGVWMKHYENPNSFRNVMEKGKGGIWMKFR
jgi:hypothetical protein